MERVKKAVRFSAMMLATTGVITLAQFGGLTQRAEAENGGGPLPIDSLGRDSTGTPELFSQPAGIGFFTTIGIYLEAMF